MTDAAKAAREIEEGPPTARRSRGKARARKRDEVAPLDPYLPLLEPYP